MARPAMTGMSYFPHDTDACSDEKIESLRFLYGNDGYAFYFILLERIYRTPNFGLVCDDETLQILGRKVGVTHEKFLKMLETSFRVGCFSRDEYETNHILTSNGIRRRSAPVQTKRAARKTTVKGGNNNGRVSDNETTPETDELENNGRVSDNETTPETSKGKKRKEKESKVEVGEALSKTPTVVVGEVSATTTTMDTGAGARISGKLEAQVLNVLGRIGSLSPEEQTIVVTLKEKGCIPADFKAAYEQTLKRGKPNKLLCYLKDIIIEQRDLRTKGNANEDDYAAPFLDANRQRDAESNVGNPQ